MAFLDGWPAHSSDLNPIENCWGIVKRRLGARVQIYTKTDEDLQLLNDTATKVCDGLTTQLCSRLCDSFLSRVNECIERKGQWTHY